MMESLESHSIPGSFFKGNLTPPPQVAAILEVYMHFSNVYRRFSGAIKCSISIKFHTQLENTILKSVTGQQLLFTKLIFTPHAYVKLELLMVPYALRTLQQ